MEDMKEKEWKIEPSKCDKDPIGKERRKENWVEDSMAAVQL